MSEWLPEDLRADILAQISPTEKEIDNQRKSISELSDAIARYARSLGIKYSFIRPQGSTGRKQTQLHGASDIDLFVALDPMDYDTVLSLPEKERNRELDNIFEGYIDSWFIPALNELEVVNMEKAFSQHPYLSGIHQGNDVDVLICFDLTAKRISNEGPITAVDRTVHHSDYVADRLNQRLREDVRILKSFIRASHAYGDTCAVGQMGFTGVSLELLVIDQNGIDGALKCIPRLEEEAIDPLERDLKELREIPAFRDDYIFIIDPIDTNRNIASSFSKRSFRWVKHRINQLMSEEPLHKQIFLEEPISDKELPASIKPHAIIMEFESKKTPHYTIIRDKLYSYARRVSRSLEKERTGEERFGKVSFEVYFEGNRYALGFLVEKPEISHHYLRRGPPIDIDAAKEFRKAHPTAFEEDGYLWIEEERRWTFADELIEHIISSNPPENLERDDKTTKVGRRLANVLFNIVTLLENFHIE